MPVLDNRFKSFELLPADWISRFSDALVLPDSGPMLTVYDSSTYILRTIYITTNYIGFLFQSYRRCSNLQMPSTFGLEARYTYTYSNMKIIYFNAIKKLKFTTTTTEKLSINLQNDSDIYYLSQITSSVNSNTQHTLV
jgi:hypothetical protein